MTRSSSTLYFTAIVFCAFVGHRGACTSIVLQELCLLVLGPYPDEAAAPIFQPDWDAGPALIPAVRLAVDKINNRTDILNGYRLRLLEGDSGCDVKMKAVVSFVGNVFRSTRYTCCPVVGIIGPGCTGAATFIGSFLARDDTSLLHISPSATSPLLTDSSTYPNTFRVLSSSLEYVSVYMELMKHNGWNTVAALYDADREYFLSTFEHFRDVMESEFTSNIGYSSPVSDDQIPLSDIYAEYRVVFAFVGASLARKILCLAYHFQPSLIYPAHQWIFHDRTEEELLQNISFSQGGTHYNCSEQQMMMATEGIILNVYRLKRDNVDTKTDVDLTLYNFSESYNQYLTEHLREVRLTRDQYSQTAEDYAPVYYDATWAMAFSLNRSDADLVRLENITLSDYSYGIPQATAIIKHHLSELQFEGISGRVTFQNYSTTIIDIYQLRYTHSSANSSSVLIGYYNDSELNMSGSAEFISDSFDMVIVTAHEAFSIVFSIVIIVATGCVMALQFLYVRHRNSSSIKASSPQLSHLIFSGCYLLLVLAFMIVLISSKWLAVLFDRQSRHYLIVQGVVCNVGGLCNNIGLTLIVGTLCVQQWRLYRIFNRFQVKHYFLSDKYLVCFVVCLAAINLTVMGVWISIDPKLPMIQMKDVSYSPDGSRQPVIPIFFSCVTKKTVIYGLIPSSINMVIAICFVALSILNRHIRRENFTTASGTNVYVFVTTGTIVLASTISFLFPSGGVDVHYVLVLWEVCFLSVVFIVCVFLFLPRVKPIIAEAVCSLCRRTTN